MKANQFVYYFLYVYYFIEYGSDSLKIFLKIFLSLRAVIFWILLNMPVIYWVDISSMNCCTVVGYFVQMIIIHALVIYFSGNTWFHGLFFKITGRHRTCCDVHSTGKRYQWEYPLVENLLLPQIYHLWWRGGLRDKCIAMKGQKYLCH